MIQVSGRNKRGHRGADDAKQVTSRSTYEHEKIWWNSRRIDFAMLSSASLSIPRREDLAALGCVGVIFRHDSCCCASAICGPEIVVEEVRRRGGSGNNMKSHEYDVTETSPAAGFLREPADRQPRPSSPRSTSGTLNPLPCHRKRRPVTQYVATGDTPSR